MGKEPNKQLVLMLELGTLLAKWWWTAVAGLALGLAGGILYYNYAPKVYKAKTVILVTPPQISEHFVQSVINNDMSVRLQGLKERVLSREYLTRLIAEVHGEVPSEAAELDRALGSVGRNVDVWVDRINYRTGTGMFSLSYADADPKLAAKMANKLAELYIEENARTRTASAASTADTLKSMAETWAVKKRAQEEEIRRFKARNLHALGDSLDANMKLLSSTQSNLEVVNRNLKEAQTRLDLLESQREQELRQAAAGELVISSTATADTPAGVKLAKLQSELRELLSRYQPTHPAVRAKRQEIDDLIASEGLDVPAPTGGDAPEAASLTPLEIEIRNTRSEIAALRDDQTRLSGKIDEYQSWIEATPRVDQELAKLTEGYAEIVKKYQSYEASYQDALGSLEVERSNKGEQFEIIDKANPPTIPKSPDIRRVYLVSTLAGLALLVGPMLGLRLLSPTVASEAGLKAIAPVPVLVSISEIPNAASTRSRNLRVAWNLVASASALAVLGAIAANFTDWFAR